MPYVSIFENFQSYCHIQNQNSRISQVIEFRAKNKKPLNLRPKMSYVDVFIVQLEENIVILE